MIAIILRESPRFNPPVISRKFFWNSKLGYYIFENRLMEIEEFNKRIDGLFSQLRDSLEFNISVRVFEDTDKPKKEPKPVLPKMSRAESLAKARATKEALRTQGSMELAESLT